MEKKNKFCIIIFFELSIVVKNFIEKGIQKCQANLDIFLNYWLELLLKSNTKYL